jgi:HPt (histidine-containing phosphotransfer) domain-containing protein
MNLSQQAMERLAQQHQKYLAALPGKRERILAHWQNVQAEGWGSWSFAELKTEVHRLAGSAGSYGLEALGGAARQLDGLLGSELRISVHSTNIVDLVDELLAALDDAVAGHCA